MKNSLETFQPISFLTTKSTCHQLSDDQVNVLSRGLKFIPTPATNKTIIRRQLLRDFEQLARRMRLQYIVHGQNKEPHPFHVKSNWMPPVQQSIALESYLESVKTQLADIRINKPKNNLSRNEMAAIKELKNNSAINLKKADKGTTTVIMNKSNKIQEAEVQLENREHYQPLEAPIVSNTQTKVIQIIDKLHRGKHIDDMTKKWLAQTPSPPRIPVFYTLTKIHKPVPVGRPIISGCDGPTEKISSFIRVPKGFRAPGLRPKKCRAPGLQDENFRALGLHIICFRAPGSVVYNLDM